VRQGHDLLAELESAIGAVLEDSYVQTHLEPRGQQCSYDSQPV
jgi:hypothetical protein